MFYCKIYGERNSGTNFLKSLMEKNFPKSTYGRWDGNKVINNKYYFWKHGPPRNYLKGNKENKLVTKIFIVRNLEKWLVSMFHNPYHVKRMNNFESFLLKKIEIENRDEVYLNNKFINNDDINKTIFELRYYKYQKIKEYCDNNENIVLVNLDYIQNDENCIQFLKEINNRYKLNKTKFSTIEKHSKNSKNMKNVEYKTNYKDYQTTIDLYKNVEIENEINNLTYYIKMTEDSISTIYSKI